MSPSPTRLPTRCDTSRIASGSVRRSTSMRASTPGVAPESSSTAPVMNVSVAATCGTAGAMYADATACARAKRELCARSSSTRNASAPTTSGAR